MGEELSDAKGHGEHQHGEEPGEDAVRGEAAHEEEASPHPSEEPAEDATGETEGAEPAPKRKKKRKKKKPRDLIFLDDAAAPRRRRRDADDPYAPPADDDRSPYGEAYEATGADASRGARFVGAIVDGLAFLVVCIPALVFTSGDVGTRLGSGFFIVPVLIFSIYQWYITVTTGQTVGKKVLGIRIVRMDGKPLGFLRGVVMRSWVIPIIATILNAVAKSPIGSVLSTVDAVIIFGGASRCLHDYLAETRVISVIPGDQVQPVE